MKVRVKTGQTEIEVTHDGDKSHYCPLQMKGGDSSRSHNDTAIKSIEAIADKAMELEYARVNLINK